MLADVVNQPIMFCFFFFFLPSNDFVIVKINMMFLRCNVGIVKIHKGWLQ